MTAPSSSGAMEIKFIIRSIVEALGLAPLLVLQANAFTVSLRVVMVPRSLRDSMMVDTHIQQIQVPHGHTSSQAHGLSQIFLPMAPRF
jgi:hypothetical protein